MISGKSGGHYIIACLSCGYRDFAKKTPKSAHVPATQAKVDTEPTRKTLPISQKLVDAFESALPTEPRRTRNKREYEPGCNDEADVVELIRIDLPRYGWEVYRIQQRDSRRAGSDPGVPDLLCVKPQGAKKALVVLLEVKHRAELSKEQKHLCDMRAATCVRTRREARIACGINIEEVA
jgi:hypothetical protein